MTMPSGITQPRSITVRVRRARRPTCTPGSTTDQLTVECEWTRTLENSTERNTAPEMMQPPDTSDSMATPRRSSWLCTNVAGGSCGWYVQIGHLVSYRSSSGTVAVRSMLASQYASIVPTSRQYGSSPACVDTQLRPNGCATAQP